LGGTFGKSGRLAYLDSVPKRAAAVHTVWYGKSVGVDRVATAVQRRGWDINSVSKDHKSGREKNRAIRTRQRAIGRELRRIFDDVAKEPVPDDFLDLLRKIDDASDGKGKADS
jgi:hypothetical protein